MSGFDAKWAALIDQNERFVQPGGASHDPSDVACTTALQWAELASQRERLADASDPLFGLASSRHSARHLASGMRLVASPG